MQKAPAHGILPLLIWALAVDGQEPTGLKLLQVEPAGTLRYLGKSELAKGGAAYASCELAFARRGAAGGPPRYVRHLAADLADSADPGPLAHLATKGDVAVLLSRAGALAGEPYGRLRALLLQARRVRCVRRDRPAARGAGAGRPPGRVPPPARRRDAGGGEAAVTFAPVDGVPSAPSPSKEPALSLWKGGGGERGRVERVPSALSPSKGGAWSARVRTS